MLIHARRVNSKVKFLQTECMATLKVSTGPVFLNVRRAIGNDFELLASHWRADVRHRACSLCIMRSIFTLSLLLAATITTAQVPSGVWRSPEGTVVAESKARRSVDGFGVWLVVTSDKDWESKWNTPSWVTPKFTEASNIKRGGSLTILIFVANAKPGRDNNLNVLCDLKITRPDGSLSVNEANARCLVGALRGQASNVRLSEPVIRFNADPGDLAGTWRVEVNIKDINRGLVVPVETAFELVEK